MGSQLSPGIVTNEFDLTTVVPSVASTEGAIAGVFRWGPVKERTLIDSETKLVGRFHKPTNFNAETFFVAADFLSYGNKLYVTRVVSNTAYNAGLTTTQVLGREAAEALTGVDFVARYPGDLGNSIGYSVCASNSAFAGTVDTFAINLGANNATFAITSETITVGDLIRVGSPEIGFQDLEVTTVDMGAGTVSFKDRFKLASNTDITATRKWKYYKNVSGAPVANSAHIVVYDVDGKLSGVTGAVLETYNNVGLDESAKLADGTNNFYKEVINAKSNWLFATADDLTAETLPDYVEFAGGADGEDEANVSLAALAGGYDLYKDVESVDVSLILQGKAVHGVSGTGLANYIMDNICLARKDCIALISPPKSAVVNNPGYEREAILTFLNNLTRTSYGVLDSGYKYRYDRYNDVYRWVPLNGDVAGLIVRTDETRDPWWSPAGYNRGHIKNVVKLAYNPGKADRDVLYPAGVNAVITQPGHGTILFGDKTLHDLSSAFDRINVRRLFIVLEKAISKAAKAMLFEFNDAFTRAQFVNMVEPYLRDVQGRRGIYDFKVVCDESNNTGEVIDRNEFVGDIYIKPARSISYITLNFVAVRTAVDFNTVIGQF
ncbi:tail sheath monomer [Sinorhizobium phage phiM7]|uniref:Tail sheath monomer n=2 Tax=Emdodecavirus TaxID=1980937 RepID=S5MCV4_9CAUD|nr:tail sheath [Sinorhizobium phage phiM12]YP_009601205.1 tail sheath [Sinorhizobium phage phiM7]AGR47739.1 tail sheath monomer [Sinorhizobium phage phiM12]AKF12628.1 tail sheath monomer [Sinorhizobium phage phiM7]AKF12988.1 tail sheath monomer [Sinorhizobium phage phiM19]